MKRVLPAVLAFLGVACISAAIAVPLWLVPQLKVVPLDLDITTNATSVSADGSPGDRFPAVIFDRCSVNESRARTLQAHLTQQRRSVIVDPSDRRQATVQAAQTVRIDRTRDANGDESVPPAPVSGGELECDDGLLTASIDKVSVNRKTSVPNGTVSSVQVEAAPEGVDPKDVSVQLTNRQGFQYKFPFNTKKRSYLYYDLNSRQDTEATFVGVETIDGVETYHFQTKVPEKDLSSLPNPQNEAALGTMLTMPARWWGISGRGVRPTQQVSMHRYATVTRDLWVEPQTGTIVDGREDQHQYFRSPYQDDESTPAAVREFRLDALKTTFEFTDATVSEQAGKASGYKDEIRLGGFWLPLILGIVGAVLLLAAVLLFLRGRRARRRDGGDDLDDDLENTDSDTEIVERPDTTADAPEYTGSEEPTVVDRPHGSHAAAAAAAPTAVIASQRARHRSPASPVDEWSDEDEANAYLWDSPTQRIPRVEGPAPKIDGEEDFRPVDGDSPGGRAGEER
ncbi:DUF3068 domain-containing protein [Gordonia sp. NPDC003504]